MITDVTRARGTGMTGTKTLLVGDDGSAGAGRAVDWACELAAALDDDLVALRVIGDRDDATALIGELEHRCAGPAESLGVACACRVVTGDARHVLERAVLESDAEAAVVGDAAHWRMARPHLGSVAGHLAHHSARPVVVVPDPDRGASRPGAVCVGRLVVGVDGSAGSEVALAWAAGLASRAGASVLAAHFHDPLADSYPHPEEGVEWRSHDEPEVRAMVQREADHGVDIDLTFRGAHRVEGLLDLAEEVDAAMIVVGARGHASLHHVLLGGTAMELLHHSHRPVGVVPNERDVVPAGWEPVQ